MSTRQAAFRKQQAPEGCGHGFGTQVPPSVQVPVQAAWVVTVQTPSMQQEPIG